MYYAPNDNNELSGAEQTVQVQCGSDSNKNI